MTDISLPQEIVNKIVEKMANNILEDGLTYGLRTDIENELKQRILESEVVDSIADATITYILDNQDAIVKHIGSEFIKTIGGSLSEIYREAARAIVKKVKW